MQKKVGRSGEWEYLKLETEAGERTDISICIFIQIQLNRFMFTVSF